MSSKSVLQAQVRTRSNTPVMCPHHRGNKAVLICLRKGCNAAFACVDCVATTHRGHVMKKLEIHAAEKKIVLKNKMKTLKDNVLDLVRQKIETTKKLFCLNQTRTKEEQQKIFKRCNALKEELDEITRKCIESCERTREENDKKLTEHLECLESIYTKYKSEIDKCAEVIEKGSNSDILLLERELPGIQNMPPFPDTEVSNFKSGGLTNENVIDLFGEVTSMVDTTNISYDISNQPGLQHAPEINVLSQFALESDTACVCGLLYPSKRMHLYVWFINSNSVSVVTPGGNVIDIITLQQSQDHDNYIVDSCVSPVDDTLWSLSTKGRIQQTTQDGTQLQSIMYFVGRHESPESLCVTRSQEVVLGVMNPTMVFILTTTGKVVRTLKSKEIGLISYIGSIIQCQRTGRLAFRDLSSVAVVDENYNHLYTIHGDKVTTADGSSRATGYTCEEKNYPRKMCFDFDGNLLVVYINNYSVIMFGSNGQYIQTIVKETEENKRPTTINTSLDRTLWVAYRDYSFRHIKYK